MLLSINVKYSRFTLLCVFCSISNPCTASDTITKKHSHRISHLRFLKQRGFFKNPFFADQKDGGIHLSAFPCLSDPYNHGHRGTIICSCDFLMSLYALPSRWHQHTCQGMHMSYYRRCFLLEGKGSVKDSITLSMSQAVCPHTQCLPARENN